MPISVLNFFWLTDPQDLQGIVLWLILESYASGRPKRGSVYEGKNRSRQFGRMCAKLGIAVIAASSPEAKGRIKRMHGTHQDRLVKKLRRKQKTQGDNKRKTQIQPFR